MARRIEFDDDRPFGFRFFVQRLVFQGFRFTDNDRLFLFDFLFSDGLQMADAFFHRFDMFRRRAATTADEAHAFFAQKQCRTAKIIGFRFIDDAPVFDIQ